VKKYPFWDTSLLFRLSSEVRKGQLQSNSNSPGDCCSARVRAEMRGSISGEPRHPCQVKKYPKGDTP
ncbi:MAG: hypothetical protein II306_06660, partial [Clostridia bacterium]|nr:hypothetical protein [Clostridia bacterium]